MNIYERVFELQASIDEMGVWSESARNNTMRNKYRNELAKLALILAKQNKLMLEVIEDALSLMRFKDPEKDTEAFHLLNEALTKVEQIK